MRVVLHEWSCSGGLHAPGQAADGPWESVIAEGRAMLGALLADGLRAGGLDLTLLLDADQPPLPTAATGPARIERVARGAEIDRLVAAAAGADWTVIVAPETGGLLAARVAAVRAAGGRVAAPHPAFIARAADKHATVIALAAGGVPVPAGRRLEAGERWPPGFALPAVVKALDGCGGDGFARLDAPADLETQPRPRRLERHATGISVGVAALCGPAGHRLLPPLRHRFATRPAPRFLGATADLSPALAARASGLAGRAIAAVERAGGAALGWVGVDMILGDRDDGSADRVLEINPRLTTSFVGLARAGSASLLGALLATAAGTAAVWPGLPAGDGSYSIEPPGGAAADARPA